MECARHRCRKGALVIPPLTIVHTSDLGEIASELAGTRPRVFPRLAGLLRTLRPDLLTDGGDTLPAVAGGEPRLAWIAAMAYTAWVPGNHDLDLPAGSVIPAIAHFGVPVVAANLATSGWRPRGHIVASGGRVGIVGLARAGHHASWTVGDPVTAAARTVAELRQHVDTLILLSHHGADADAETLRAVGGFDLVLTGHLHQALPEAVWIGDTPIVQVGANGRHVGVVRGAPGGWSHELLPTAEPPPRHAPCARFAGSAAPPPPRPGRGAHHPPVARRGPAGGRPVAAGRLGCGRGPHLHRGRCRVDLAGRD